MTEPGEMTDAPGSGVLTDGTTPTADRRPLEGADPGELPGATGAVDGDDPEVGVETREISLDELQEAAERAGWVTYAGTPVAVQVDLVEAEAGELEPSEGAAPSAAATQASAGSDAPEAAGPDPEVAGGEPDPQPDPAGPGAVTSPGPAPDPTPDTIDPRIHERRIAVTVEEGRRRRRIVLIAITVASVVGVAWLIVSAPFLSVRSVHVEGATRETRVAVERAAAVKKGSPLLFLDTGEVARRVEALPWVARADVERDLPNGLTISVEERLPVAWARRPAAVGSPAGTLGPVAVVDVSGRVLGDEPQPPAGLPEILGLPEVPARGGHVAPRASAAALAALPDALRAQTAALEVRRGAGVLKLGTPPGGARPAAGEVRLGKLEQVAQKGAAAIAVLDQLVAGGEVVRYVDVRVPGAPATR